MDESKPKNRRERRALAKESGKPTTPPTTTPKIKLQHPDRSAPQTKTLLDLYEEKRTLLDHGQPFDPKHHDGLIRDESGNILKGDPDRSDPIGPVGNAIFWSLSLSMIHFTLDVIVYNQYSQKIDWTHIFTRALKALPMLFLSLWLLASRTASRFPLGKQFFFFAVGVYAGCYVIHAANRYGYLAVMKQAPPLGTLWIWSVVEMRLEFAVVSLGVNLAFLWYQGYSVL